MALALNSCTSCFGSGWRADQPCKCVYRAVFRMLLRRYEYSRLMFDSTHTLAARRTADGLDFGWRNVDFVCDFDWVCRRTLTQWPLHAAVLQYAIFGGLDWYRALPLVNRRVRAKLDKGKFFHTLYETEEKLGRAFLERGLTDPLAGPCDVQMHVDYRDHSKATTATAPRTYAAAA